MSLIINNRPKDTIRLNLNMCVRNKINIDIRRWEQIQINLKGGKKERD